MAIRSESRRALVAELFMGFAATFLFAPSLHAQTATEPALHHRGSADSASHAPPGSKLSGASTLPADVSGEYEIDEANSVVQITIEGNRLTGYITKLVDEKSSLTFFFDQTSLGGNRLAFTTKQVHGTWYSFEGTIIRGDSKTKQESGFYRLKGTWIAHDNAAKNQSTSMVSLKSTPRSNSRPD
jgi:hypothetical protein